MSTNDDDRVDDSVQEQRIEKHEAQARQAAGGQMMSWESDVLPTDEREQCWQRVMHFENAPLVSDFQRLTDAGMQLHEPDTMNDGQLTATLWKVIHGLASMRVFLSETDHLSDRSYTRSCGNGCSEKRIRSFLMIRSAPGTWICSAAAAKTTSSRT